jgi:hypothetical protein
MFKLLMPALVIILALTTRPALAEPTARTVTEVSIGTGFYKFLGGGGWAEKTNAGETDLRP